MKKPAEKKHFAKGGNLNHSPESVAKGSAKGNRTKAMDAKNYIPPVLDWKAPRPI